MFDYFEKGADLQICDAEVYEHLGNEKKTHSSAMHETKLKYRSKTRTNEIASKG